MLPAVLAVIAALAFVLGLGALCLWGLKRWGKLSMSSRSRIAVEVVQRIPLGPKTGLAVVRVGEKVMAVSVGEGGIRTLFELDEADRQRVLATSDVPTPMTSSGEATAAFAKFLPGAFGRAMSNSMAKEMAKETTAMPRPTPTPASPAPVAAPLAKATAHATMVFSTTEAREIPSFLTAAPTTRSGQSLSYGPPSATRVASTRLASTRDTTRDTTRDGDFRAMLGGALSGATRLAVFTGAMVLASAVATPLHAQAAPPTSPPVTPPASQPPASQPATVPTAAPLPSAVTPSAVTPAATATAPQTLPLPALPTNAAASTAPSISGVAADAP